MQMKGTTNPPDFAREIGILKKLFRGRQDVYGTVINGEEKCIRKPLTDQIYTKHLNGATRIGVYLILPPENIVCLACIDVDEENRPKVEQIMACLLQRGFYPYLERSRAKGYHVWVFFDNPIQASVIRSLLKAIMMEARISHIEIFPKQDAVASGKGVGNFIFLPLFGESVKDKRTVFLNLQFQPYQDQWDYLSQVHLTKSENVLELSNQFTLQQPPKIPAPVQNLAGPYNA
jgi:hypothetical protein